MRLLHTTNLELVSFIGKPAKERPPYAILSHTWSDDEFIFEEARDGIHQHLQNPRRGLRKILNACEKAKQNKLDYIWVDTCCIDKSSSAELSEAINSMFKWYKESFNCYVFMDDVSLQEDGVMGNFDGSRWFTRGWTLQELIAPHGLSFFDRDWKYMCSRFQIASRLEKITGITKSILQREHDSSARNFPAFSILAQLCSECDGVDEVDTELAEEPIARKMAWAADRSTTRPEDTAYCLLGLFGINMPLLYGEGENAFWRLQEEILKKSPDQSILTWTDHIPRRLHKPYLARMPSKFRFAVRRPEYTLIERGDIIVTPRGLEIDVLLGPCGFRHKQHPSPESEYKVFMAILSCAVAPDPLPRVAIFVDPLVPGALDTAYTRVHSSLLVQLYPAAEPSIISAAFNENIEVQDVVVDYDPRKLTPSRILLTAIRPTRDHFKQRTGVYIVAPGIERVKTKVRQWIRGSSDAMISYEQSSSRGRCISTLSIGGVWHLANDHSGFFVLWGVPSNSADGDFVAWTETWGPFLQGNPFEASPSSLDALYAGLDGYVGKCRGTLSPYVSGPGFKVKVNVSTTEFLGRKPYRVIVDIEGWEDSPVSIINYVQVVADVQAEAGAWTWY